jgi:hypothetical protein
MKCTKCGKTLGYARDNVSGIPNYPKCEKCLEVTDFDRILNDEGCPNDCRVCGDGDCVYKY